MPFDYLPGRLREPLVPVPPTLHKLIVQPDDGLAPILRAIQGAHVRIRLKMFDLSEPALQAALGDARSRGVNVKVLLNKVRADGASMNLESEDFLEKRGVNVRWANPKFTVTHEKSLVVDDTAYICTFNFNRKCFEKSRGYGLTSRDPKFVQEVLAGFDADWQREAFEPAEPRLLWGGLEAWRRFSLFLDGALTEICLQHKKLTDTLILERLMAARQRGVRVRFLSSGNRGVHRQDLLENAAACRILARGGGEVHFIKRPQVHGKLIVVDGKRALLGSMNLARDSFLARRELGVFLEDPKLVRKLQGTFERDWLHSVPHAPDDPLDLFKDLR